MTCLKTKCGFTLIEISLAILIISVGILSVIGLIGAALDTSKRVNDDLYAVSFSDLVFSHFHSITNWAEIPAGPVSARIRDYNGEWINIQNEGEYTCRVLPRFGNNEVDVFTVTYRIHAKQLGELKTMDIEVWPGYRKIGRPRQFHTEFYNWTDR